MAKKVSKTEIQDGIVDGLESPCHGLIKLAPRVGKSRIAVRIIKNEKPESILWVTPNTKLRDVDIPAEFVKWHAKRMLNKTSIICYGSLSGVKGHVGKIVLDEYQDITEANSAPLLDGTLTYDSIIALSGSHPKHQEKIDIYNRLNLKTIAEIDIDEAIEMDLISDYRINVVEVSMDNSKKIIEAGNAKKRFMVTEYKQYQYLNSTANRAIITKDRGMMFKILARMRAIYTSPSKEEAAVWLINSLKGRKLIFAGSIAQAERLSPNTYHSKTDNVDLQAFLKQETDILCCVKAGGVGFTYHNVDNFIIVQADSDKKGETTQRLARSLMKQKNYIASIYIITLLDTQDTKWTSLALQNFDKSKIKYNRFVNLVNERT